MQGPSRRSLVEKRPARPEAGSFSQLEEIARGCFGFWQVLVGFPMALQGLRALLSSFSGQGLINFFSPSKIDNSLYQIPLANLRIGTQAWRDLRLKAIGRRIDLVMTS